MNCGLILSCKIPKWERIYDNCKPVIMDQLCFVRGIKCKFIIDKKNNETLLSNTFQRIFFLKTLSLLNKNGKVIYFVEIIVGHMHRIFAQFY